MTRYDAIVALMKEARTERTSTAAAKRVVRACTVLGLDDAATRDICGWLDFCRADGTPYSSSVERVWP